MHYHTKKNLPDICQTATYNLIRLLVLAMVVVSCIEFKHKPSAAQTTRILPSEGTTPICLDAAFIKNTMKRFGYLGQGYTYITYLNDFGTCYEEYLSKKGDTNQGAGISLAVFTAFAGKCPHHSYLKEIFDSFMQKKVLGHSDCKKDPRFFVLCTYVKCMDRIRIILEDQKTSKQQKVEKIEHAIATFKTETEQVHSGKCGKKFSNIDGVAFEDARGEKGYTLSDQFEKKLEKIYTDLSAKFEETKKEIQNYNPTDHASETAEEEEE